MESTLQCSVCLKPDPLCSTNLDIPICAKCWKDPGPRKQGGFNFTFEAEIDKITSKIFLGNEEAQKRKRVLKALGVTNILVMGSGLDILHKDDFIYKRIEIDDFYSENIGQYFEETYNFIEKAIGNVYVHCVAGISRSPSVVIAYIMRKEGKNFEEAMQFVKERRTCVNPNEGFIKQLKKYGEKIKNYSKI